MPASRPGPTPIAPAEPAALTLRQIEVNLAGAVHTIAPLAPLLVRARPRPDRRDRLGRGLSRSAVQPGILRQQGRAARLCRGAAAATGAAWRRGDGRLPRVFRIADDRSLGRADAVPRQRRPRRPTDQARHRSRPRPRQLSVAARARNAVLRCRAGADRRRDPARLPFSHPPGLTVEHSRFAAPRLAGAALVLLHGSCRATSRVLAEASDRAAARQSRRSRSACGLLGLAAGRPLFAGVVALALAAGFALADYTMRQTLARTGGLFRGGRAAASLHPPASLPAVRRAWAGARRRGDGLVARAWRCSILEPPLWPPYPVTALAAVALLAAGGWASPGEPAAPSRGRTCCAACATRPASRSRTPRRSARSGC